MRIRIAQAFIFLGALFLTIGPLHGMIISRVEDLALAAAHEQVDDHLDDQIDNGGGETPGTTHDDEETTSTVTMDTDPANGDGEDTGETDGEEDPQTADPIRLFNQALVAEERDIFVSSGLLPLVFSRRYLTIDDERTPFLKHVRSPKPASAPAGNPRVPLAGGELGARWGHTLEMKLFGPGSLYWPGNPDRGENYFSVRQPGRTWSGGVGWANLAAVNAKQSTKGGMGFTGDSFVRTADGGRLYPPALWMSTPPPGTTPNPTYRSDTFYYDGQGVRYRFGTTGRLLEISAIGNGPDDVIETVSVAYDTQSRHRTLRYTFSKTAPAGELAQRPWMRVHHNSSGLVTRAEILVGTDSSPVVHQSVRYFYTASGTIPVGPQTPYTELLKRVEFWNRYENSADLPGSPNGLTLSKAVEYQYNSTGHMTAKVTLDCLDVERPAHAVAWVCDASGVYTANLFPDATTLQKVNGVWVGPQGQPLHLSLGSRLRERVTAFKNLAIGGRAPYRIVVLNRENAPDPASQQQNPETTVYVYDETTERLVAKWIPETGLNNFTASSIISGLGSTGTLVRYYYDSAARTRGRSQTLVSVRQKGFVPPELGDALRPEMNEAVEHHLTTVRDIGGGECLSRAASVESGWLKNPNAFPAPQLWPVRQVIEAAPSVFEEESYSHAEISYPYFGTGVSINWPTPFAPSGFYTITNAIDRKRAAASLVWRSAPTGWYWLPNDGIGSVTTSRLSNGARVPVGRVDFEYSILDPQVPPGFRPFVPGSAGEFIPAPGEMLPPPGFPAGLWPPGSNWTGSVHHTGPWRVTAASSYRKADAWVRSGTVTQTPDIGIAKSGILPRHIFAVREAPALQSGTYSKVAAVLRENTYDAAGRAVSRRLTGDQTGSSFPALGQSPVLVYDHFGRPQNISSPVGSADRWDTAFAYRTLRSIRSVTGRILSRSSGLPVETRTVDYAQDGLGRLLWSASSAGRETIYAYDGFGSRTKSLSRIAPENDLSETDAVFGIERVLNTASRTSEWGFLTGEEMEFASTTRETAERFAYKQKSPATWGVFDVTDMAGSATSPGTQYFASPRGDSSVVRRRDGVLFETYSPTRLVSAAATQLEYVGLWSQGADSVATSAVAEMTLAGPRVTGTTRVENGETASRTAARFDDSDQRGLVRSVAEWLADGSVAPEEEILGTREIEYDAAGRVAAVHLHDAAWQPPASASQLASPDSRIYSQHFRYDAAGRIDAVSFSQGPKSVSATGRGVTFNYDADGRIYRTTHYVRNSPAFGPASFGGALMVMRTDRAFDEGGRLQREQHFVRHVRNGALELVRQYDYTYNALGYIAAITQTGGSTAAMGTDGHAVVSAFGNTPAFAVGGSQARVERSFAYDTGGRLRGEVRRYLSGNPAAVVLERRWSFTYSPKGELLAAEEAPARPVGGTVLLANAQFPVVPSQFGRIADGNGYQFGWNTLANELRSASAGSHSETHAYNVSGQRVGTLHTRDGAVLWRSRSLHLGPNEAVERITHETNEGPVGEVWQNYFTGGYDSLAGATRRVGAAPADEYLFIRDHLGSVALTLRLTVHPGFGADFENPKVATKLGHEAELAMREGFVVAFAEDGEIVVGDEAGIAAADGSSEAAIRTAGGDSLVLKAAGGKVSVELPGGGEIASDEGGVLLFADDDEGRVSVESLEGGALSMDSLVQQRPVGTSWSATLAAVEEYEYTPYGVPTVRSNEGGQSVLRVWDEIQGGTGVWSNPREGRAAGAYLCASDSPTGATDAFARVTGTAAQSSIGLRFLYTARPWSPVGEIYYYRARWYAPECGRFISRDPIGYAAGPTQYGYVGGNPIMRIDPTGLIVIGIGGTGSAADREAFPDDNPTVNRLIEELSEDGEATCYIDGPANAVFPNAEIEQIINTLTPLIENAIQNGERVVLIGHSRGGAIANQLANDHGAEILVLLDPVNMSNAVTLNDVATNPERIIDVRPNDDLQTRPGWPRLNVGDSDRYTRINVSLTHGGIGGWREIPRERWTGDNRVPQDHVNTDNEMDRMIGEIVGIVRPQSTRR